MKIDKVILDLKSLFRNKFPESEVYLYGSRARGDNRVDSDYDILVLLPDSLSEEQYQAQTDQIYDYICRLQLDNYDDNRISIPDISMMIVRQQTWASKITPFSLNVTHDRIKL